MAIELKGLTIDEIRQLNTSKLSTSELRQVTNRLNSAANKRVNRLEKDPYGRQTRVVADKPASGNMFSTKGLRTRSEVKAEFDRARNFLDPSKESHTLRGAKKMIKRISQEKGISEETLTNGQFWADFRQYMKDHPDAKGESGDVLLAIAMDYEDELEDWLDEYAEEEEDEEWEEIDGYESQTPREELIDRYLKALYEKREKEDQEDYFGGVENEDWSDEF